MGMCTRIALSACVVLSALSFLLSSLLWSGTIGPPSPGEQAKDRQCEVYPISLKLYRSAARYSLISERDLRVYEETRPAC